jgi:hypothetical protein
MRDPENRETEVEAINFFNANADNIDIFATKFFNISSRTSIFELIKKYKLYYLLLNILSNPSTLKIRYVRYDKWDDQLHHPVRIISFVIKSIVKSVFTHEYLPVLGRILTDTVPYTYPYNFLPTLLIYLFLELNGDYITSYRQTVSGDDLFTVIKLFVDKIRQHFISNDDSKYEQYLYKEISVYSNYLPELEKYDNYDPIMLALRLDIDTSAENGLLKGIKYILDQHNKSINYYNNEFGSRIHMILWLNNLWVKNGKFDNQLAHRIFERFIALGGDINFISKYGTTALDMAMYNKNHKVINLLKYFGAKSRTALIAKPALPFIPRRNNKSRSRVRNLMPQIQSAASASAAEREDTTPNNMPMLNGMISQLPSSASENSTKILSYTSNTNNASIVRNTLPNSRLNRPRTRISYPPNAPSWTRKGGSKRRSTRRRK